MRFNLCAAISLCIHCASMHSIQFIFRYNMMRLHCTQNWLVLCTFTIVCDQFSAIAFYLLSYLCASSQSWLWLPTQHHPQNEYIFNWLQTKVQSRCTSTTTWTRYRERLRRIRVAGRRTASWLTNDKSKRCDDWEPYQLLINGRLNASTQRLHQLVCAAR